MFIEVDLCQVTPLPEDVRIKVYIKPKEREYEVQCHKDDDQTPCELLDSWLTMEFTSLEDSLCDSTENSTEETSKKGEEETEENAEEETGEEVADE